VTWPRGQPVRLRMLSARPDRIDDPFGQLDFVDWVE